MKYLDTVNTWRTNVTGTIGPTGATIQDSFFIIPSGTGATQRIGRKVTVKSLMIRMTIERYPIKDVVANTNAYTADTLRVIVALDRQTNGLAPVISDLLASTQYQSYNSLVNKGRFTVLWDNVYTLNDTGVGSDGTNVYTPGIEINVTFMKKLNLPIEYSGTNGTVDEIRSNNICMFAISKLAGSSSTIPDIYLNWTARVRYADM